MTEDATNTVDESAEEGADVSDLVDSQDDGKATDSFTLELEKTLNETHEAVKSLEADTLDEVAWKKASQVVEDFKPVPWFMWRLTNYVLGQSGKINEISQGMVYGMRRLMFAIASDPVLGAGEKVDSIHRALAIVPSDVIAAVCGIHSMCRRLSKCSFERIWRPIIDDALLRTRIGHAVGEFDPEFGSGRGMLAGFAGRSGLAILISSGEIDEAQRCLESLASGTGIQDAGRSVYKVDPLQISAMTLSAAGCSRDAAFGTVSFASPNPMSVIRNDEQLKWLAAFTITEKVRMGNIEGIDETLWEALNITEEDRETLMEDAKLVVRRGHGWNWMA